LFGEKIVFPFKISWVIVVLLGASVLEFEEGGALYSAGENAITDVVSLFWLVADTLTGLMAAPNLIALLALSPLVARMSKEYFASHK